MNSEVLDKGYVRLVNSWGTELDIANSARVSYDKESNLREDGSIALRDQSLIKFLVEHKHDSTLRHCGFTFEIYAPLMVARQWYKHAVASTHVEDQLGWNESSRRYVTENEEFYIPKGDQWRSKPDNSKQGSGDLLGSDVGGWFTNKLWDIIEAGNNLYQEAMAAGIAPEQARLFLPAYGMYVRWRWTTSLNSALHFLTLRKGHGAQNEIVDYANVVGELVKERFPITTKAWEDYRI